MKYKRFFKVLKFISKSSKCKLCIRQHRQSAFVALMRWFCFPAQWRCSESSFKVHWAGVVLYKKEECILITIQLSLLMDLLTLKRKEAMDMSISILNSMHYASLYELYSVLWNDDANFWNCQLYVLTLLSTCHATLGVLCPVLVPTFQERHEQSGKGPMESTKMTKGVENLSFEERLKDVILERRKFGGTSSQYPRK